MTCRHCGGPVARVSWGWAHVVNTSGRSGTVDMLTPPDHPPEVSV